MYKIDYNSYRTVKSYNTRVRFLVLHYTAENFEKALTSLTKGPVSSHYLVPDPTDTTFKNAGHKEVSLFNLVDEKDRAWHAGLGTWENQPNLNDSSIGIEIVNVPSPDGKGGFNFPEFNQQQIDSVIELCKNIIQRYPEIHPKRIIGHADLAYTRKEDPGPKFPWKKLHDAGIGTWWDDAEPGKYLTYEKYLAQFKTALPSEKDVKAKFASYGYYVPPTLDAKDYTRLIQAFQMHFRQSKYDGVVDAETCAILYTLVEKYNGSAYKWIA